MTALEYELSARTFTAEDAITIADKMTLKLCLFMMPGSRWSLYTWD
jgi:hypothetical protein